MASSLMPCKGRSPRGQVFMKLLAQPGCPTQHPERRLPPNVGSALRPRVTNSWRSRCPFWMFQTLGPPFPLESLSTCPHPELTKSRSSGFTHTACSHVSEGGVHVARPPAVPEDTQWVSAGPGLSPGCRLPSPQPPNSSDFPPRTLHPSR